MIDDPRDGPAEADRDHGSIGAAVEGALTDLAQAYADADQAAADLDAASSKLDRGASVVDGVAARSDQASADADQAASDREYDGEPHTSEKRAEHERSRLERVDTASRRRAADAMRSAATTQRGDTETDRHRTAELRDQLADERDRVADVRDRAIARAEQALVDAEPHNHALIAVIAANAIVRNQVRADRQQAARDRGSAAHDRSLALTEREHAKEELEHVQLDSLTGVYTRRLGLEMLQHEIDRCRRGDKPFVLAFVDIDHLKVVNDRDGHAAGDALIRSVADACRAQLRTYDPIVRAGGDEFLCGLPATDLAAAYRRAAQIRKVIAAGQPAGSVSVGLALLRAEDDLETLIGRADRAMYEEKRRHK